MSSLGVIHWSVWYFRLRIVIHNKYIKVNALIRLTRISDQILLGIIQEIKFTTSFFPFLVCEDVHGNQNSSSFCSGMFDNLQNTEGIGRQEMI